MARRGQVDHRMLLDGGVEKQDLNIDKPNHCVITQLQAQSPLAMSSTGADPGTGIVTLSLAGGNGNGGGDELVKISALDSSTGYLFDKVQVSGSISKTIATVGGVQTLVLTSPPSLLECIFSRDDDVVAGKWLKRDDISTDSVPMIMHRSGTLTEVSLSNEDIATGVIRIFRNGTTLLDISLNNTVSTLSTCTLSVTALDTISAKCISGFMEDVILSLLFEF